MNTALALWHNKQESPYVGGAVNKYSSPEMRCAVYMLCVGVWSAWCVLLLLGERKRKIKANTKDTFSDGGNRSLIMFNANIQRMLREIATELIWLLSFSMYICMVLNSHRILLCYSIFIPILESLFELQSFEKSSSSVEIKMRWDIIRWTDDTTIKKFLS